MTEEEWNSLKLGSLIKSKSSRAKIRAVIYRSEYGTYIRLTSVSRRGDPMYCRSDRGLFVKLYWNIKSINGN